MQFTLGMPFLGVLGKFDRNRQIESHVISKFYDFNISIGHKRRNFTEIKCAFISIERLFMSTLKTPKVKKKLKYSEAI